jgi:hypothetical protein
MNRPAIAVWLLLLPLAALTAFTLQWFGAWPAAALLAGALWLLWRFRYSTSTEPRLRRAVTAGAGLAVALLAAAAWTWFFGALGLVVLLVIGITLVVARRGP